MAMVVDAESLDPILPSDNASIWTMLLVFDQLVRSGTDGRSIEPGLAQKWEISKDGKTYTFHLRKAQFSTGDPVTVDDVIYSLERARSEKSRWASFFRPIEGLKAVDAQTVQVTLKEPFTPFLANLALFSASIVPKAVVEKAGDEFATKPIGSGPFVLDRWDKGSRIVLAKNPHYWQAGKPHLDRVEFQIIGEDNTRMLKLQAGEVDVAADVPANMLQTLRAKKDARVQIVDQYRSDFVNMNTTKAPFTDKKIREALNLAVNRAALIKAVLYGSGVPENSYLPRGMKYWDSSLKPYAFDLARAKKLMAESSKPQGFPAEIIVQSGDTVSNQVAVILQDQWKAIGVTLKITQIEGGAHWDTTKKMEYDLSTQYMTSDTIDPDQLTGFAVVNPGRAKALYTGYQNPEVNALFEKGRTVPDGAAREAIYKKMQTIVKEDAPFVFLYSIPARYAYRMNVKGFAVLPTGNYRLEEVSLSK
ncbi:MAG: ABC transporter substrate-binding protein [Candidatus Rokubacteria bacterium]|nr:ABC transporter substrate-binding protein [Candidatus Rokubacteria bacterium]